MSEWIKATDLGSLKRRKKQLVSAGGQNIALFYLDGEIYALRDICIHKKRHLSKGLIFQGKVVCPGHQWAFDLKTGWVDQWAKCQPTYKVKVEGEEVFVDPEPHVRTTEPASQERCQPTR